MSPLGSAPPGRDPDGLTRWQAARVERRLAVFHPEIGERVRAALGDARAADRAYLRAALAAGHPARDVLTLAERIAGKPPDWVATRLRLVDGVPGGQYRLGARIDQVDATTCGTAVLLVLATGADPVLALSLTAPDVMPDGQPDDPGFGTRFDRRQLLVHRQSNLCWPRALGTTPWGMTRWLARRATGVGPYRVRWAAGRRSARLVSEVDRALALGERVPLLVGARLPRHYVLALGRDDTAGEAGWWVYEPSSGEVRVVPVAAVRERRLARWLGFDRMYAALLPAA
ncbi:hypothetical protein ACTXG6_42545 [Pseudonocardia sp. Cha107L01]|uniref:hypothetical protein n=1 Tax=Pseudonocardia sp. Cha107L01 TaxID=3457576 RepID=UPI00403E9118